MNQRMRVRIKAATVRFMRRGGQGVLVPGQMIVTAAHVVHWDTEGGMTMGAAHYVEDVRAGRRTLKVEVLAIEPVADIAVLGAPDGQASQELFNAAEAFADFCESTAPVPICTADFRLFVPFPVHILTHTGRWVTARATQNNVNASTLFLEASEGITGGTSGSPLVTDRGRLIGVLSTAGGTVSEPATSVTAPRLHLAAPGWLVRLMRDPGWEIRKTREAMRQTTRRPR